MSDGSDATTTAQDALAGGDLSTAEKLSRAALADGGTLADRLTLAQALAWQGQGRDADAVLSEVDESTLGEADLMAWALPRAANQFWMLDQPERATAFLRAVRSRVTRAGAGATVDALLGTFAMNAGSPGRARQIAHDVLVSSDADDQAVGWAGAAAALCDARMGTFSDVDELAARAVAAGQPGLLRFTSAFGQMTALIMTGHVDRARALAEELVEAGRASEATGDVGRASEATGDVGRASEATGDVGRASEATGDVQARQPGHAIADLLLADVLIAQGEAEAAVALLESAATALAPTGYSWGPLASTLLALGLAQADRMVDSGRMLARAESRHGLKSMLFAPELALARAWTRAARHDGPGAIDAARESARAAERSGQSAVALRALLDAVRLGDTRAVDAIARLNLDCVLSSLASAYATAFAAGDGPALRASAAAFAGIGLHGISRDAARQADAADA